MASAGFDIGSVPPSVLDALKSGDVEKTKELLLNGVCHVNSASANGTSLLHIACQYGHTSLVKALCSMGADMYKKDYINYTPAFMACEKNKTDTMLALIDLGYNVNHTINSGFSLLHCACQSGNMDAVQVLLSNKKFKVQPLDTPSHAYWPPFKMAINCGYLDIALLLIVRFPQYSGINIQYKGKALLYYACKYGNVAAIQVLVWKKNYKNLDSTVVDDKMAIAVLDEYNENPGNGMTPLHVACRYFSLKMVCSLCDHGTDVNAKDNDNDTPLALGVACGRYEIVFTLLKEYKSNPDTHSTFFGVTPLQIACSDYYVIMVQM